MADQIIIKTSKKKKPVHAILTERDMQILTFLKRIGYADLIQLTRYVKWMGEAGTSEKALYNRLLKLTKEKYINSERIRMDLPRIYYRGSKAKETGERINISWLHVPHTLAITEVLLKLLELGIKEDDLETEREKKSRLRSDIVPGNRFLVKLPKIPDIIVMVKAKEKQKLYALEIELTKKNTKDMDIVLDNYAKETTYTRVYYICANEKVADYVRVSAAKKNLPFVTVLTLVEFMEKEIVPWEES